MTLRYIITFFLCFFILNWNCYSNNHNYTDVSFKNQGSSSLMTSKIRGFLNHGANFLYKPESFKADMDSARFNFNKAFVLSHKIKNQDLIHECLFYHAEVLFEENKYTMALKNFDKIIAFYRKEKQFEKEAKIWEVMGSRLFWKFPRSFDTMEESAICFDKASLLYKNLGLQEKYAYTVKSKADAHLNQGRLDLAEKELLQVLDIYNKIGYKKLHFTYDLLADTQRLKGDLGKSLHYSLLCVKSMEKTGDYRFASDFYEQLAVAYRDLGKHQLSIELLKKAIYILKSDKEADFANLYEFTDLLSKELCEVGNFKEALHLVQKNTTEYPPKESVDKARVLGSLAYCYNKNNQIKLAESNYLKMIDLYEKKGHGFYIINLSEAYFQLGKFYQEHKKYEKAKVNFQKSLNFSEGIVELNQIKEANLYLFKVDSAQGKYFSAIKYFQKYKNLNDSIFNEKKNKQIEELQILYGLEKKEKEFSNLKLAMDAEKGKTTQAKNMIKFSAGIVLLLLACILIFWKGYQSKQKNNKLLISQKSEIDQKNTTLQKLVAEKESLMKEIHHRVKNNLQIVMSLLSSQSNTLKNKEAFDAIQKSQQRLYAISLLHQKLYKTDIVREIEMKNYIDDLLLNFAETFDLADRINFEIDVEVLELDEAQAVSVGLILNEAVTNSIKHAFPDNNKGTITIAFKPQDSNKILFQISDNGIGLPADFNFETSSTLGISLIKGLAEQLDGEVSFINNNGLTVRVEFVKNLVSKQ